MNKKDALIFWTFFLLIIGFVISTSLNNENGITGAATAGTQSQTQPDKNQANELEQKQLIGPSVDCSKITSLPYDAFIQAYESPAWPSGTTLTRKEYVEIYALQNRVHPALVAAHATQESGMGTNNKCTKQGKSALTGCGWPTTCASGCRCSGLYVGSDEKQIQCTSEVDRKAYEAATGGQPYSVYGNCAKYAGNNENLWKCILCTYVHGSKDELDCDYQKKISEYYCQWLNYYGDTEFALAGLGETNVKYYLKPSLKIKLDYNFGIYETLKGQADNALPKVEVCFNSGGSPEDCAKADSLIKEITETPKEVIEATGKKDYTIKFKKSDTYKEKPIEYKFAYVIEDNFAPPIHVQGTTKSINLNAEYDAINNKIFLQWKPTSYDYAVSKIYCKDEDGNILKTYDPKKGVIELSVTCGNYIASGRTLTFILHPIDDVGNENPEIIEGHNKASVTIPTPTTGGGIYTGWSGIGTPPVQ